MTEIEFDTRILTIDDTLPQQIEKMNAEGWMQIPHVRSLAIFHVQRLKGMVQAEHPTAMGVFGTMKIDESKVHLVRNGKIVEG